LNAVWKAERWLMDLIGFARDKDKASPSSGIPLKYILDKTPQVCLDGPELETNDVNLKIDLLQIPSRDGKITKTSPGRGSWPGPAGNGNHTNLHPEFSKSEQQLSIAPRQTSVSTLNLSSSQYLNAEAKFSRKGSADSQYTQSSQMSNNFMSSNSQFDIKSPVSHASGSSNRLLPSRSEDTLVLQTENVEQKPRPHSINASSVSNTSSPLLTVKGFYPGSMISVRTSKGNVSESAQSLSSDSESQSCPITSTSVPLKLRPQGKHFRASSNVITSKSMTNVKSSDVDYTDTGQELFAKPTCVKRQPLLESQEDPEYNNKIPKTDERNDSVERQATSTEQRPSDQPGILQVNISPTLFK
jgi:ankyrin repeat and fibronectin type-III domain-containing protein 1